MSQLERDLNLMDSHIRIVNWRNLRYLDWLLVVLVAGLAYIGLSNMYSASYGYEGAEATRISRDRPCFWASEPCLR